MKSGCSIVILAALAASLAATACSGPRPAASGYDHAAPLPAIGLW